MRGTTVTDPCGRSFLSYRRTRIDEAKLLIAAQHDLGIPTWYDLENLEAGPTDDQLRATLNAATTANAIVWLTPDVAESLVIGNIELPLIIRRERRQDGFFAVPVAAGGLGYSAAANAGAVPFMAANLAQWNQCKVAGNPIVAAEAGRLPSGSFASACDGFTSDCRGTSRYDSACTRDVDRRMHSATPPWFSTGSIDSTREPDIEWRMPAPGTTAFSQPSARSAPAWE